MPTNEPKNLLLGCKVRKKPLNMQNSDKQEDGQEEERPVNIYLSDEAREGSLMVLGVKGSGKSAHMIPIMFKQDLKDKEAGVTVICNSKDMAYTLYTMARAEKRKVCLLKPTTNFEVLNGLINMNEWNYGYIQENIINYKKAIKDKQVVIIDMEYDYYRQDAVRATTMLLLQLQTDMCITQETKKRKHFVYIDDAQHYLPFIEMLITCGSSYNMYTTLFFQGRNQFSIYGRDYTALIDNNVRNTLLMNNINFDDAKYYSEKLCPENIGYKSYLHSLMHLQYGTFVYDIQGEDYSRKSGVAKLIKIPDEEMEKIKARSIKERKKLTKYNEGDKINPALLQPEIAELYHLRSKKAKVEQFDEKEIMEETGIMEMPELNEEPKVEQEVLPVQDTVVEAPKPEPVKEDIDTMKLEDPVEDTEPKKEEIDLGEFDLAGDIEEDDIMADLGGSELDDIEDISDLEIEKDVDEIKKIEEDISDIEEHNEPDIHQEDNDELEFELDAQVEVPADLKKITSRPMRIYFPNSAQIRAVQKQYNRDLNDLLPRQ